MKLREEEFYEQYHQHGGTTIIPTEIFNELYDDATEEIERLNNIIKEVREKVDSFDVFKEFTFPLMKRDVEQQVKSSIDYEWRKSVKKPILEILDKADINV